MSRHSRTLLGLLAALLLMLLAVACGGGEDGDTGAGAQTGAGTTEVTLRQDRLLTHEDREGNREGWRLCFAKLDRLLDAVIA